MSNKNPEEKKPKIEPREMQNGKNDNPASNIAQIQELVQRLAETEAALKSVMSGQIDAIVDPSENTPILLQQAQDALRRSEARYHRLITRMSAIVFELDPDGTVLEVNDAVTRITGYKPDELIGHNLWLILFPGDQYAQAKTLLQLMQAEDVSNYELNVTTKSGQIATLELNSANYYRQDGELERIVGLGVDITQRKLSEQTLANSRDYYLQLIDQLPTPMWRANENMQADYFNKSWLVFTGRNAEEDMGEGWIDLIHPEDRSRVLETTEEAYRARRPFQLEYRLLHHSGEYRWILDFGQPFEDLDGRFAGYLGSCYDLSQHKNAETALRDQTNILQSVLSSMGEAVVVVDRDGRFILSNPAAAQITGQKPGKTSLRMWAEGLQLYLPDGRTPYPTDQLPLARALRGENVDSAEVLIRPRNTSKEIWTLVTARPLLANDGNLMGGVMVFREITDRKQTEEALQKAKNELEARVIERTVELSNANQWLQAVLQSLPVGVWIADKEGRIVQKNDMADQIWGGEAPLAEDIQGYGEYVGWWSDSGEKLKAEDWALARAITHGERSIGELIDIQRFDGARGTILNSAVPVYDAEGNITGAVVASQDNTHQRSLERQAKSAAADAQRQAEELDAVFKAMADAVILIDAQGVLRAANPAAEAAYGFDPVNMTEAELAEKIHLRYLDNRPVPFEELPAVRALSGEMVRGEHFILRSLDGEDRLIVDSASPLYAMDGSLSGTVVVWSDVTERERLMVQVERERDKLRTLIDNLADEVWFCDADANLVLANKAAAQSFGLEHVEDLFGPVADLLPKLEIYDAAGQPLVGDNAPLLRSLKGETIVGLEEFNRNVRTGELRYRSVNSSPLRSNSGKILGAVAVVRDITERKRAEDALRRAHDDLELRVKERTQELAEINQELRAEIAERRQVEKTLRESEERYRLVVESVKEYAIFTLDPQGYVTSWNMGAQNIKGYSTDEIIGRHFSIFFPQEQIAQGVPDRLLEKAIAEGRYELEDWRVRKDGSQFWANIVLTPLRDEAGRLRGFSKVIRDMTHRKEADEAIQRQTSFVKLLQEVAVAANQAGTIDDAMQFALERVCAYTGWRVGFAYGLAKNSKDRLVFMNLSHLDDPERYQELESASQAAQFSQGEGLPGKAFSTGSPVWMADLDQFSDHPRLKLAAKCGLKSGIAFPVLVGEKVVGALEFFGQAQGDGKPDQPLLEVLAHIGTQLGRVVERKQSEDALRHSETRFRTIFEGAATGIELVDLDGHLLACNPALAEMLGYSDEELRLNGLTRVDHPANVVAGGSNNYLFDQLRAGKRDFYRQEKQFERKDGGMIWGRLSVSLVRNIDDKPQFAIGMLENITEHKQMESELNELRRRLMEGRESERVELAQELHDGPMQELYGLSFHLKAFESGLPADLDKAEMSEMQGNLQQVVRTLRAICGELRPPALAPFGLEKAIRSHADAFQESNPDLTIGLDLTPDGQDLPEPVRLALFRIYQQALTNVVRHAKAQHVMIRFLLDAEQAVLEVQDDGKGFVMPTRWIDLARQGHLGLVGALERAESIGGELEVDAVPGEGTTLRVVVPASQIHRSDYFGQPPG